MILALASTSGLFEARSGPVLGMVAVTLWFLMVSDDVTTTLDLGHRGMGTETLQHVFKRQRSIENRNGLGFCGHNRQIQFSNRSIVLFLDPTIKRVMKPVCQWEDLDQVLRQSAKISENH